MARACRVTLVLILTRAIALRILTFGDSLTAGVERAFAPLTPYGNTLEQRLATAVDGGATVVVSGVPLESAHAMPARLARVLASEPPFDCAIILGGTNDIWSRDVARIWASLSCMYGAVLDASPRLGVVTLPPFSPAPLRWLGAVAATDAARRELNARIRDFAAEDDRAFVVDLAALCDEAPPRTSMGLDDGIHLSPAGYRALGDEAFAALSRSMGVFEDQA